MKKTRLACELRETMGQLEKRSLREPAPARRRLSSEARRFIERKRLDLIAEGWSQRQAAMIARDLARRRGLIR